MNEFGTLDFYDNQIKLLSWFSLYTMAERKKERKNLDWPLHVYGVVAARDCFDHNRNILFSRSEANCQRVTQDDPFLHLIGPSRAIVAEDRVRLEVELKMKYGAESKDTALLTSSYSCGFVRRYSTILIYSRCCMAELSLEGLTKAIQATIVGVRVVKGEWPCMYGCRVSCSLSPVVEERLWMPRLWKLCCLNLKAKKCQHVQMVTYIYQGMWFQWIYKLTRMLVPLLYRVM